MRPVRVWAAIGAVACVSAAGACQFIGGISDIELAQSDEAGTSVNPSVEGGLESGIDASGDSSLPGEGGFSPDAVNGLDACGVTARCVERAPPDWIGPLQIYEGVSGGAAPTCAPNAGFLDASASPDAGPASCDPCSCNDATGESCGNAYIRIYNQSVCSETDLCSPQLFPLGQCISPFGTGCTNELSLRFVGVTTTGGSCNPTTPTPNVLSLPSATWGVEAVACHAEVDDASACNANEVCTQLPGDSRFAGTMCIAHDGQVPCPSSGPFTESHVYYTAISDSRGCANCGCGPPDAGACSASQPKANFYDDGVCGVQNSSFGQACHSPGTYASAKFTVQGATVAVPGRCAPTGGGATGTVTGSSATTFCCLK
jgi:hypothetical protein